jgi:hypothetical protein
MYGQRLGKLPLPPPTGPPLFDYKKKTNSYNPSHLPTRLMNIEKIDELKSRSKLVFLKKQKVFSGFLN